MKCTALFFLQWAEIWTFEQLQWVRLPDRCDPPGFEVDVRSMLTLHRGYQAKKAALAWLEILELQVRGLARRLL